MDSYPFSIASCGGLWRTLMAFRCVRTDIGYRIYTYLPGSCLQIPGGNLTKFTPHVLDMANELLLSRPTPTPAQLFAMQSFG